jgi:predicted regulator of Ras-like GTPase activity (Roadblock/LC7/MglB family)
MAENSRNTTQILLYSTLVVVVPMVLFPELLGTTLLRPALMNLFFEVIFYVGVLWFFNRDWPIVHLAGAAGLCAIYRLILGAIFGVLISQLQLIDMRAAIQLGMSSYLPAILLHAGSAPFILMSLLRNSYSRPQQRAVHQPSGGHQMGVAVHSGVHAAKSSMPRNSEVSFARTEPQSPIHESALSFGGHGLNGFDRATHYIGEHNAVNLAAVVDHEGLLLSRFTRDGADAEMWAPYAIQFMESNGCILKRGLWGSPERLDLTMQQWRIVVCREQSIALMVVAERAGDDLLAIRINQGLEIIRKYYSERYSHTPAVNAEKSYASSTQ